MDASIQGHHEQNHEYMQYEHHDGDTCESLQYGDRVATDCWWQYAGISYVRPSLACPTVSVNNCGLITGMPNGYTTYNEPMTACAGLPEPGFFSQWSVMSPLGPHSHLIQPPSALNHCFASNPTETLGYFESTSTGFHEPSPEYVQFGEEASSRFEVNPRPRSDAVVKCIVPGHASRTQPVQLYLPPRSDVEGPNSKTYCAAGPTSLETAIISRPLLPSADLYPPYIGELQSNNSTCGPGLHQPSVSSRRGRVSHDLYTPVEIDGFGIDRVGKCTLCSPPRWLKIKTSEYWYDKMFRHGINAATGEAFRPPAEVRAATDHATSPRKKGKSTNMAEGRCHNCGIWLPLGKLRDGRYLGVAWIRHAYKCQKESQIAIKSGNSTFPAQPFPKKSRHESAHRRQYSAPAGLFELEPAVHGTASFFGIQDFDNWLLRNSASHARQE